MGTVDPLIAANNVLDLAFREGIPITPMKLQRVLYFIYREYLALTGEALFAQRFEAWKYGPVLAKVYDAFKGYEDKQILEFHQNNEGKSCKLNEINNPVFAKALHRAWSICRNQSGVALSRLLQQPGTAWRIAWDQSKAFLQDEDIAAEIRRRDNMDIENKIYTHDEAAKIVEMFEEILEQHNIKIPDVEDDQREEDNAAALYGMVYSNLLDDIENTLIALLEQYKNGAVVKSYEYSGRW